MLPDDPRHGKNAGYIAGCDQPCCKTAHADYKRDRRTRVYLAGGPMKVDATGTRRRIQALVALGHTMEAIDHGLGKSRGYTFRTTQHREVYRATATQVAALYDAWSMTVPPSNLYSNRNRNLAQRRGWLPPLMWDDDTIDDPNVRPKCAVKPVIEKRDIDPVVIERLMSGDRVEYTVAERREAVVKMWHSGIGPVAIGQRLGISGRIVDKDIERLGLRRRDVA